MALFQKGELGSFGDGQPTVIPSESTPPTQPMASGAPGGTDGAGTGGDGLQERYNRLLAETAEWRELGQQFAQLGGARGIAQLLNQIAPLAQRPDFQSYLRGELVASASDADDEFLSDEQREIRTLQRKLEETTRKGDARDAKLNDERAVSRVERLEADLLKDYGQVYKSKRPAIMAAIQRMVATGGETALSAVTYELLHQTFVAALSPREFREFSAWLAENQHSARESHLNGLSTTPPHTESPAGKTDEAPKNVRDAVARGLAETRDGIAQGRITLQ